MLNTFPPAPLNLSDADRLRLLSDHTPVMAELPGYGTALIWNILTKCYALTKPDGFLSRNNAMAIAETPDHYEARLVRVAQAIGKAVRDDERIRILALQEVPTPTPPLPKDGERFYQSYFFKALKDALPEGWNVGEAPFLHIRGHNFGNLLVTHQSVFIKSADRTLRFGAFGMQSRRAQVVDLTPADSNLRPLRFANVHMQYESDTELMAEHVRHYLRELLDKPENMALCIAGDFNIAHGVLMLEKHFKGKGISIIPSTAPKAPINGLDRCDPEIDFFLLQNF